MYFGEGRKEGGGLCRPLIHLNGYYNRDPNIKALKGRGIINRGSTLVGEPMTVGAVYFTKCMDDTPIQR